MPKKIMVKRCGRCHWGDDIAPLIWVLYEGVKGWWCLDCLSYLR